MAKKSNHTLVAEWRHPVHRTGVAVTSIGLMLRKVRKGGTWTRTHPKVDATLADLDAALVARGYERLSLPRSAAHSPSWVPNPRSAHNRRLAAKQKRQEARQRALAIQLEAESAVLPRPDTPLTTSINADLVRGYVVASLKGGRPPLSPILRYVYDMARFHGGATSGYLGTALYADDLLPEDYAFRRELDAIADQVARTVFGTDLAATHLWSRALGL